MPKVLFLACSSHSGSTLLTFLANLHSKMISVGHMVGWDSESDKYIQCSCGERLDKCPFFRNMHESLKAQGLPFSYNHFGTGYNLVRNEFLNRTLTAHLPYLHNSRLEAIRDLAVRSIPIFSRKILLTNRINHAFIESALAYKGADVFVENAAGNPFRLRLLRRIQEIDIYALYLVRDFRGVALSNMKRRGWDPVTATKVWLRQQGDILRIVGEDHRSIRVYYEDFATSTNETLAEIHRFVDLEPRAFDGDFKATEHHVLGNVMRLKASTINPDTRWRTELSAEDLAAITNTATAFVRRHPGHPVSNLVEHYLST